MDRIEKNCNSIEDELWNHGWYHGSISRQDAVDQIINNGDFLVRDCISAPGTYVLTCKNPEGKILHFRMNNILQDDGSVCYQFEDDCYCRVSYLIDHHIQSKKPISALSNAVLLRPVERGSIVETHYQKLKPAATNGHHRSRSHSSMSGSSSLSLASSPPVSTGSGSGKSGNETTNGQTPYQVAKMKSCSRASLLASASSNNGKGKNALNNGYGTTKSLDKEASQLKRFKSLPHGKINRRVKRKAPSPPKNVEPYKPPTITRDDCPAVSTEPKIETETLGYSNRNDNVTETYKSQPSSLHLKCTTSPNSDLLAQDKLEVKENNYNKVEQNDTESRDVPKCPEGVKLRRRAKCLQQKYNFNQRQSMYCAKLQQFSNFLKGDNRRHSFYGLGRQENRVPSISLENVLDSNEDIIARREKSDNNILDNFMQTNLLRSPSDSSLMYLNQIAVASGALFEDKKTKHDDRSRIFITENSFKEEVLPHHFMPFDLPPALPPKASINFSMRENVPEYLPGDSYANRNFVVHQEGTMARDICSPQIMIASSSRTESQQSQYSFYTSEAIYDTVPKPRSCLTKEQLENNHIYDIPRRLMAKHSKVEDDVRKKHTGNSKATSQTRCDSRENLDQKYPERSSSSFDHSSKRNGNLQQRERICKSNYGSVTSINLNGKMRSIEIDRYLNGENDWVYENNMTYKSIEAINHDDEAPMLPPRQPRLCQADIGPKLPPKNRNQFNNVQPMNHNYLLHDCTDVACNANRSFAYDRNRTKNRNFSSKSANSMDNIDRNIPVDDKLQQHYERCQSYTTNGMSNDQHFAENGLGKRMEYIKTPYGEVSSSFTESTSTLKSTTSIDTFSSLPPPPTDFELHHHEELSSSLYSLEREFASLPPIHSDPHDGSMMNKANSQNLSIFSSVSSVTLLQEGDGISLDNSSLPGDPFPQGLPQISSNISLHSSSSSSTLESPMSSPLPPPKPIYLPETGSPTDEWEKDVPSDLDLMTSKSEKKRSNSRNDDSTLLMKHNSESNLSRVDVEFEKVEEQGYTLLQSIDVEKDLDDLNQKRKDIHKMSDKDGVNKDNAADNDDDTKNNLKTNWHSEDSSEEDAVILRRHSWQYADNELLLPDSCFPSIRPKSDISRKEVIPSSDVHILTTDISKQQNTGQSELLSILPPPGQSSKMAEDILFGVVDDVLDVVSINESHRSLKINNIEETKGDVLSISNERNMANKEFVDSVTSTPIFYNTDQNNKLNQDIDGSFKANDMSDIIDELIDLTIKHRNICYTEVAKSNGIELTETNGYYPSLLKNGVKEDIHGMMEGTPEINEIQIKSSHTYIDPINFKSNLLHDSFNQSLDPRAINATKHILLTTSSSILALHLTKVDTNMLLSTTNASKGLLILVEDKGDIQPKEEARNNFISNILERCVCLKTFVVVTILTAMNVEESAKLFSKWIEIAFHLKQKLGNYFGFYNVLSGLTETHLIQWGDLWICLKENQEEELIQLECELRPLYLEMKEMKVDDKMFESPNIGLTLPHIVPYMSLFPIVNRKPIFQTLYQNTNKNGTNQYLEQNEDQHEKHLYFKHLDLKKICLSSEKMFLNLAFDDTLLDLFRTEYHIKLLWGSQSRFIIGYPENADEGHEEFEKVIATLFEMCSMARYATTV